MSNESKEFFGLVKDNKMFEAKQIFNQVMNQKLASILAEKRIEVAKKFFNKQQ